MNVQATAAAARFAARQRIERGLAARQSGQASSGNVATLPNFPSSIAYAFKTYTNWSGGIQVQSVPTAVVHTADDVVLLANWAQTNGYSIRALGQSHNWSPLVLPPGTAADPNVLLVDTRHLTGSRTFTTINGKPAATFGIGTTLDAVTAYLAAQDNQGSGAAPGYTFQNMPGPGSLTLGGALAIGAHGTGTTWSTSEPTALNGSLSNLILAFTAVVTDPNQSESTYALKQFQRSDPDAGAFLVHLGRAFLTDVTLQVIPNYYLQVTNWYPDVSQLFEGPSAVQSPQAISTLLDQYGRLEVIWFPYTQQAWVKTWEMQTSEIQPQVLGPYNYPWANSIDGLESELIRDALLAFPSYTPDFGVGELTIAQYAAPAGGVMNGPSRDLLLYVKDTTLRVGAFGYAIQLNRSDVQAAANTFFTNYTALVQKYQDQGLYPVNTAVEIRYTTMDLTQDLADPNVPPPALSASHAVNQSLDTVFWVDALTVPGTTGASAFFAELEAWMASVWGISGNDVMRPEWSKGWAYTANGGAWTNQSMLTTAIPAHYSQSGSQNFQWVCSTLAGYDGGHIYTNAFLDVLLPG